MTEETETEEQEEESISDTVLDTGSDRPEILRGKIESISEFGVTQIDFTKFLKTEFKYDNEVIFDYSYINGSVLDIFVAPV